MELSERVRRALDVEDLVESAFGERELTGLGTSQDRYRLWRQWLREGHEPPVEHLLPRFVRKVERTWPAYLARAGADGLGPGEVLAEVRRLGPWRLPYRLAYGITTMTDPTWRVARDRILYRRSLITATVAELLGDDLERSTVLDLGCNNGFFSLDLADRGAARVDGVDLRPENIAQARFLARHHGLHRAHFDVADVDRLGDDGRQWDVVLNLGLLYHVTQPLELMRSTYERCRRLAVIDTRCTLEPFSGFVLRGDKDVSRPTEGRERYELHPTYRGTIDAIRYAGFSDVYEIAGLSDPVHPFYDSGTRRCFLALK